MHRGLNERRPLSSVQDMTRVLCRRNIRLQKPDRNASAYEFLVHHSPLVSINFTRNSLVDLMKPVEAETEEGLYTYLLKWNCNEEIGGDRAKCKSRSNARRDHELFSTEITVRFYRQSAEFN
ncbi:hypothetical protein K0M31_006081 [Melipona bicolor]|uniref:Uncharacterized protein n=1 Tax=Melipona bicolor TaxID=60889 RepID=A0AA40FSU8_9HYME|nr:hypothetical protein K0M31_006081 [Melipona bicolor]